MLDEIGAESGSTTISAQEEFVVARSEAIYLYSTDGRGPCFVFEGKTSLANALPPSLASMKKVSRSSQALSSLPVKYSKIEPSKDYLPTL